MPLDIKDYFFLEAVFTGFTAAGLVACLAGAAFLDDLFVAIVIVFNTTNV
ncbi:hypothetical protein [Leeuwenhoekiella sp. MAR_2009_132]|nr:hypothetical protein [Leeuwenhoekiella sp. MAR_2009_132]